MNKHGGTFLQLFPRMRDQARGNKCEYVYVEMFPRVHDQARGNIYRIVPPGAWVSTGELTGELIYLHL